MDALMWIRIVALALVLVLDLILLLVQSRTRRYSRGAEIARAAVAVLAFFLVFWATGARLTIVFASLAAVIGLALGFLSGYSSRLSVAPTGQAVKTSMWPAIVTVLGYTLVVAAVMFGTAVIVSAALLVVLLGTGMTVGVSMAEMVRADGTVATA